MIDKEKALSYMAYIVDICICGYLCNRILKIDSYAIAIAFFIFIFIHFQ